MPAKYSPFRPETLFASMTEEVLFGRGQYTISIMVPAMAEHIAKKWIAHLLQHPLGLGFEVKRSMTGKGICNVDITLSPLGIEAITRAGYVPGQLDIIGMVGEWKDEFLTRFETALKELT